MDPIEQLEVKIHDLIHQFEKDNPGSWISEIHIHRTHGEIESIDIDIWKD